MNPISLVNPENPEKPLAYACRTCGLVWGLTHQDFANTCCEPKKCLDCQALLTEKYVQRCAECRNQHQAQRDAEDFAKAPKVKAEDYGEKPVYWEGGKGDMGECGYYHSIDSLLESCADRNQEAPTYVWATEDHHLSMDADSILESALEESYEDARSGIPEAAEKELQDYLNQWCEKNDVVSYHPTKIAVLIPEKWREALG